MQSKNVKNILSAIFMILFISFLFFVKYFEKNNKDLKVSSASSKYPTLVYDLSNDNRYGLFLSASHANVVSDFDYLYSFYDNAAKENNKDFLGKSFILKSFVLPEVESIKLANEELKKDRANILANVYLSHIHFKNKDYKKAMDYLNNLKEKSESVMIKLLRAWILTAQKKYDDAMDLLETEVQNTVFRKHILMHLANIAELSDDDEYADELYDIVLSSEKPNIFDLENVSAFYARTGEKFASKNKNKLPKHIQILKDYYAKYPESLSNYSLLDMVEKSSYKPKSIENASQGYAKALFDTASILSIVFPSSKDLQLFYYDMVASIYPEFYMSNIIKKELSKSINVKQSTENIIPENHYLYLTSKISDISNLLQNPKTRSIGLDEYKALLKKYPESAILYYNLGKIYDIDKKYDSAIECYTKALSLTDNATLLSNIAFSRAQIYDILNKKDKTIFDLEFAISKNSDNALLSNYYGYYLINKDIDVKKGLDLIDKALKSSPVNPYYLDSYGWGLFKSGDIEKSLGFLEVAKGLQPKNPIFSDHLADAYWSVGRKREAIYEWKKALQYKDDFPNNTSSETLDVDKIEHKIMYGL